MSYGLRYQCTFDSTDSQSYRILISQKDYSGAATNVTGGASPFIHSWDLDEPKPGVKGSSARINLINQGTLPMKNFYSVDDQQFKVQHYWGAQLLFEGFIVQDDCAEEMADWTHEINLSANDNLGLLKGIALDKTPTPYRKIFSYSGSYTSVAPDDMTVEPSFGAQLQIGDVIRIQGTAQAGYYTVKQLDMDISSGYWIVHVIEPITTSSGVTAATLTIFRTLLNGKVSLLAIINNCLLATGLELLIYAYVNTYEISQPQTASFLEQTLINPDTFLTNDTEYMNCYDVLTSIMERFGMTLFQANGVWNIVRWHELRYFGNQIDGFVYDADIVKLGTTAMGNPINAGPAELTLPETGLQNRIYRPYKHVKETFNYKSPANVLKNYNLMDLGRLLAEYSTGTGYDRVLKKEYDFKWWGNTPPLGPPPNAYIRVTYDWTGLIEIDRYVVILNNFISNLVPIECNKGDAFEWSFSFQTDALQSGPQDIYFSVYLSDSIQNKILKEPTSITPGWRDGVMQLAAGWRVQIPSSDNTQNIHQVTINANQSLLNSSNSVSQYALIPFDGQLLLDLPSVATVPGRETHYRDLRFTYIPYINNSIRVTGHTHTDRQSQVPTPNIKQVEETDILMDDSPKNSINGCLYLDSVTGLLQTRTSRWAVNQFTVAKRLGELIEFDELFWRRVPRTILEGNYKGLVSIGGIHISMLSVMRYTGQPQFLNSLNFVFGKLEIDYRNSMIKSSTLYEIWKDTEVDSDLTHEYLFNYIYSVK